MDVIGQRSHETATCTLAVSRALPPAMRPQVRELVALHVPEHDRRKGYGSQLIHSVCREADEHNLTLLLSVADNDINLTAYYTRFGFTPIQSSPILMARMPGSSPRTVTPIASALAAFH